MMDRRPARFVAIIRLHFFAGVLLASACSDPVTESSVPVSGIWHARIPDFGDSLDVMLSFSFDQVTTSNADGGVRMLVLENRHHPGQRNRNKAAHMLETLRRQGNVVEITGSAPLDEPFGTISFDGELRADGNFHFSYESAAGSGNAVAEFAGEYVRAASASRSTAQMSSIQDVITFGLTGSTGTPEFCDTFGGACPVFTIKSTMITWMYPDSMGGMAIDGVVKDFPLLTRQRGTDQAGDVWAGSLSVVYGVYVENNPSTYLAISVATGWSSTKATTGASFALTYNDTGFEGLGALTYYGTLNISAGRAF